MTLYLGLTVVVAGLGYLGFTTLEQSNIFRITTISVRGNQLTTKQQILEAADLQRGGNLLTLDASGIVTRVREMKWVDDVWVKRHWPSTVELVIREHKAFALVNLEQDGAKQLYYMNSRGEVFAPLTMAKDLDYPVVNGSGLAGDLQGRFFRKNSLGAMALEFLQLTAQGNQVLPTQAVSEINLDQEEGLIVYLVDHPFPIYMGKEDVRVRFGRLIRLLAQLYKDDRIEGVSEIRMDYAENKILVARLDKASS